jgi:hypothetical protein
VLLQAAPLTAPKEVAWFLASYARDAKARMEVQADLPGLAPLRSALEEALGLKFTGKDGEHFFRSSLVQTLFYGVFLRLGVVVQSPSSCSFAMLNCPTPEGTLTAMN